MDTREPGPETAAADTDPTPPRTRGIDPTLLWMLLPTGTLMAVCSYFLLDVVPWWAAVPLGVVAGLVMAVIGNMVIDAGNSVVEIGCGSMAALVMLLVLVPVFKQARAKARQTACLANLKAIGRASLQYATDHDGRLPPAAVWTDAARPYLPAKSADGALACPAAPGGAGGYAWYDGAGGTESSRVAAPDTLPLVYDSTATGRNAHDAGTSLPRPGRHPGPPRKPGRNSVLYADGRARSVPDDAPLRPAPETRLLRRLRPL